MSVSMNNLFNFSRALPEPFDKLVSKKVKVTSKYGSATEATLSCTMVKAVHAVCNCMVGTGEGAVGTIDHRTVAEYKSSAGPDMYHLVVFDSGSGNIMASIYDNNTETIENYKLHQSSQDGAAVMMAMMPLLLKDDEFDENFQTYFDQRSAGYPDMKKATDAMAILCDNAYRRIKDDTCPAHIKVTLDKSGNVLRVDAMNARLQALVNPPAPGKAEAVSGQLRFRLGDKVMQIKNYEQVNNGDVGYITNITGPENEAVVEIDFGDGRIMKYENDQLRMLDLGYASTVHKSQGAQYKSVILNLQCAHAIMLMRAIVYTAITRARLRLTIVGERKALCRAIRNTKADQRGTRLAQRIQDFIE